MYILGISAFFHDSAACLIKDGRVIAAAQEERFTRIKHDPGFPKESIQFCLKYASIDVQDIDIIAFYEKPWLKFDRLIKTYLMFAPKGISSFLEAMPLWLRDKLWLQRNIRKELNFKGKIVFPEHHMSHSSGAFFPSPFSSAAVISMDGVGEWATASYGVGKDNQVTLKEEMHFPHSLGLLYSAFTYFCGFKVNSGEYKLMGLAPYGEPRFKKEIYDNLIEVKDDGSFHLDLSFFNFCVGKTMTSEKFHDLFGRQPRTPESPISDLDIDLAASIQQVTEEIMLKITNHVHAITGESNLCLSGGVALNCVCNGRVHREGPFERLWIQPAAGDAGSALGAALWAWYSHLGNPRKPDKSGLDSQQGSYLGSAYTVPEIKTQLAQFNAKYTECSAQELLNRTCNGLQSGKVIGWFSGRMEFGPRALGARSILGDPRSGDMQSTMNLKIKYRESFRPFAPVILAEKVDEWFDIQGRNTHSKEFRSPYMLIVAKILEKHRVPFSTKHVDSRLNSIKIPRSSVPAVTHVDNSARLQTVHAETNSKLHQLLSMFYEETGCPILVNTSFNVRGEPVVESPSDAYRCFMRTEMDILVLENCILYKGDQPEFIETEDWTSIFELD